MIEIISVHIYFIYPNFATRLTKECSDNVKIDKSVIKHKAYNLCFSKDCMNNNETIL